MQQLPRCREQHGNRGRATMTRTTSHESNVAIAGWPHAFLARRFVACLLSEFLDGNVNLKTFDFYS